MVRFYKSLSLRRAEKLRMRRQNEDAWMTGAYIRDAVIVAIANTFGEKKDRDKVKYPEKPYSIFREDIEAEQKKLAYERMMRIKSMIRSANRVPVKQQEEVTEEKGVTDDGE